VNAELLMNFVFPWTMMLSSWGDQPRVLTHKEVRTSECKGHAHLSKLYLERVLKALGVDTITKDSWRRYIRNELDILGECALKISIYAPRVDGSLHRFTVVNGETDRKFPQAEECPENFFLISGQRHDRERDSGDLEGAPSIQIVAVQLDRGEIVWLQESFPVRMIVPILHIHTPFQAEDGKKIMVSYGEGLKKVMVAKHTPTRGMVRVVHPHSADYAALMLAIESAKRAALERQEREGDAPLKLASGVFW